MCKQNVYLNYVINNIGQLDHVKDLTLVTCVYNPERSKRMNDTS
jgi:hypothetical protein